MKILLSYYSRIGYSRTLAETLQQKLESRGHDVEVEIIEPTEISSNWLVLIGHCMPGVPYLLFSCFIRHLKRYRQPEVNIKPLKYPDVSAFDRVVIGGPKWMHLAFPVARYIRQVKGLEGKGVGAFATFCGPPFANFEIYSYFHPFTDMVRIAGGEVIAQLGVSSGYTDVRLLPTAWFKLLSRIVFRKPLSDFSMDSEWGKQQINAFCEMIQREDTPPATSTAPLKTADR